MKTEKKKRKLGLGGCVHQYVLGSQTSHCAQVSGIKDMEKGIKIYIVLVLAFKGFRQVLLIQGHTKTCMHTHTSQHVQHQLGRFQHHCDE